MKLNNNFNFSTDYSTNLVNNILADMQECEEDELEKILRLEKETKFNRRMNLASLIVGVATLIVAILTLVVTII